MTMENDSCRRSSRAIGAWLAERAGDALSPINLVTDSRFGGRFAYAWEFPVSLAGAEWRVAVLLPPTFPYSRPRVALTAPDHSLKWPHPRAVWPHVEDDGLLCLMRRIVLPEHPIESVSAALSDAFELIAANVTAVDLDEFRREFMPYWGRACPGAQPLYSLVEMRPPSRTISAWLGQRFVLVGECDDDVGHWLANIGSEPPELVPGLFAWLDSPPIPADYPHNVGDFKRFLEKSSKDAYALFSSTVFGRRNFPVLFAANAGTSGVGLGGVLLRVSHKKVQVKGFRPGHEPPALASRARLAESVTENRKVMRVDASWVNGRDHDQYQERLYRAAITIVGCGSLGSHIAAELAKSGIGQINLIDPEDLTSANVGRHVLGIPNVGENKAIALAKQLRRRFPHLRGIEGNQAAWGSLDAKAMAMLTASDLIVSAIGDWGPEGSLNDWHLNHESAPPIIYTWLEPRAAAGHALLVAKRDSCLECMLNADGTPRFPETEWDDDGNQIPEPACGEDFQPYGPVDLAHTVALAVEAVIDKVIGQESSNVLSSYCTSTARLTFLGGRWTDHHLTMRPPSFGGSLTFRRPAQSNPKCPACQKS